tara:strand:+ start:991 stop:1425 length:435 start_codon:yes stop_codon:yes gene_type:complete
MKKFKSLREAVTDHIVPKKDDEKNMSKNDVKVADLHKVETDDHPVATDAQHPKKGKKKFSGVRKVKANEEIDLDEEVEFIDEAVKAGMMKLKDGKSVKVSKEDAATLNSVLEDLNPDNRKRMEEELKKDVKSYKSMLTFAKRTG